MDHLFCAAAMQAFEAFDTNASGAISTSEFMSLMRTLGGPDFPRSRLLHLMAAIDSDTDRSITKREFGTLLAVCWSQRFLELESDVRMGRAVQGSGARAAAARRAASQRVAALEQRLIRCVVVGTCTHAVVACRALTPKGWWPRG